jgi:o-succinylbenzoate synthase
LLDYMNGGRRIYFENAFSRGEAGIVINGLIWMGSYGEMTDQIREKLAQGYKTLKMKVGALDFETECRILSEIRTHFGPDEITLRVDANGAFMRDEAMEKLHALSRFELHSIEQPIKAGQVECMAEFCAISPIPIALDEELIGVFDYRQKFALLKCIKPAYIILKPSLLGGFQQTKEWIEIANRLRIPWWITSALESNIGLAAIAQFTASFTNSMPQGLGTGQLYKNNFPSPLYIKEGSLYSDKEGGWDFSLSMSLP